MGILACQSLRSVLCLLVWPRKVGAARALPLAGSSPPSESPPVRPLCWVFISSPILSHQGGFPGQDMAQGWQAGRSSRTMRPQPAACHPQRSLGPISMSARAPRKHDHLPAALPPSPAHPRMPSWPPQNSLVSTPISKRPAGGTGQQTRSHQPFQSGNHTAGA